MPDRVKEKLVELAAQNAKLILSQDKERLKREIGLIRPREELITSTIAKVNLEKAKKEDRSEKALKKLRLKNNG